MKSGEDQGRTGFRSPASEGSDSLERRARDIFLDALLEQPGGPRELFLTAACAGEPLLRAEVDRLLAHHREDQFLETPAEPRLAERRSAAAVVAVGDEVGHYRLVSEIGEGGCGMVFLAEQQSPVRRRVALKVIKPGMDSRAVLARFAAEREVLALMDHPGICRVLDAGATASGRPFVAMELVTGKRITEYCDARRLGIRARLSLFLKVCGAIGHAHQKGVLHRDIKPSNILVAEVDGKPEPKVIDFGIAKAIQPVWGRETTVTLAGHLLGTPAYMSPEQASLGAVDVDTRSDIYSLGVLLYELLVGEPPLTTAELAAAGLDGARRLIRELDAAPPSSRAASLGSARLAELAALRSLDPRVFLRLLQGDLDWIVLKAIDKDRARRYAAADGLMADVQRHLGDQPVSARPPRRLYLIQKFVHRNRLAVGAGFSLAAALVLGLATSTWLYFGKERELRRALQAEQAQNRLRELVQQANVTETELRKRAEADSAAARREAYDADMLLAQQGLAEDDLGRAWKLLERHRPAPGEVDLRGWEWRYLWRQCQSEERLTLCQRPDTVSSLAASADGRRIAVGQADGSLGIWDAETRRELFRLPRFDERVGARLAPGGSLLAFVDRGVPGERPAQPVVSLWDTEKGVGAGELRLSAECRGLAFSSDGSRLLTVSADGDESVWEPASGRLLQRARIRNLDRGVRGGSFDATPDLRFVALPTGGGQLSVFETATGREVGTVSFDAPEIRSIRLSPDGELLATAGGIGDPVIRLWDVVSGQERGRLEGHRGWVGPLAFLPDGKTLVSVAADQTIRLWDVPQRRLLRTLRGHHREIWSLALFANGTGLATGGKDGVVKLWDLGPPRGGATHQVAPVDVRAWAFASGGGSVVTCDQSGRVQRWTSPLFRDSETLLEEGGAGAACFSPDGKWIAVARQRDHVRVKSLESSEPSVALPGGHSPGWPVGFVPGQPRLLVLYPRERLLREWDIVARAETRSWPTESRSGPGFMSTAVSSDGAWLAMVDGSGRGVLKGLRSGHDIPLALDLRDVSGLVFAPDGAQLAVTSVQGSCSLWQWDPLQKIGELQGFLLGVHSAAFSPDGKRLALGSNAGEAVKLFDAEGRQELVTLAGTGSIFHSLAFSPDGRSVAALNREGELHLWQAPTMEEIAEAEASAR